MDERTKEIMFKASIVAMNADHVVFEKLQLERFAELVRQDERDACIKIVTKNASLETAWKCEEEIRARGEK
jgi:hypothetical protein